MAQVKKASSTSAWAVPVCVPAAPADVFCAAATMLAHIEVPRAPGKRLQGINYGVAGGRIICCKAADSAERNGRYRSSLPKGKNVYSTANKVLLISGVSHAMAETEPNIKKLRPKPAVRLRSGQAHDRLMVLPKCQVCSPAAAGSLL